MNNCIIIDNFLSHEEFDMIHADLENYPWLFSMKENDDARISWIKPLDKYEKLKTLLKQKVELLLEREVESDRLYCNGQSHSQTAYPHRDVSVEDYFNWGSLVLYIHKEWKPIYGGHLIFIDNGDVIESIFPKTNRAVLFDGKIEHCALEPTVFCNGQRLSIAYKFLIKDAK